jgi:hypothetical protein
MYSGKLFELSETKRKVGKLCNKKLLKYVICFTYFSRGDCESFTLFLSTSELFVALLLRIF